MASEDVDGSYVSLEEKPIIVNHPGETLLSDYLLVPGVVTHCFRDHVVFRSSQTNELYELDYSKVRYVPNMCPDLTFQAGDRVESLILDSTLNVYGWATGTIKSFAGSTYVIAPDKRTGVHVVKQEKLRAITEPLYWQPINEHKIEILVPANLGKFASDLENHRSFCDALGNPRITYDARKNAVVAHSPTAKCEEIVKMVQQVFLKTLRKKMLISRSIEDLADKYEKLIAAPITAEFQVIPDMIQSIIGEDIRKVESIKGIIHIAVLNDSNTVKIFSETQEAVDEAYMYLNIAREFVDVPSKLTTQIIGRNANVLQSITDSSKLRRTVIHRIGTRDDEHVQLEFIGTPSNIESAKLALKFHSDNIVRLDGLAKENKKPNLSTKSSPELAKGLDFARPLRRLISAQPFADDKNSSSVSTKKVSTIETRAERSQSPRRQGQIFYNANLYRGGATTSLRGLRGSRSNRGRRGRGRSFQNTLTRSNDSESRNTADESVESSREVSGGFRGIRRGRERGRGRGRLLDLQNPFSSSSASGSLNDSSLNETQEPDREQSEICNAVYYGASSRQ